MRVRSNCSLWFHRPHGNSSTTHLHLNGYYSSAHLIRTPTKPFSIGIYYTFPRKRKVLSRKHPCCSRRNVECPLPYLARYSSLSGYRCPSWLPLTSCSTTLGPAWLVVQSVALALYGWVISMGYEGDIGSSSSHLSKPRPSVSFYSELSDKPTTKTLQGQSLKLASNWTVTIKVDKPAISS